MFHICLSLEGLSFVLLAFMFFRVSNNYKDLPESLPMRYDFHLQPETYGHKRIIYLYPIAGLIIFAMITTGIMLSLENASKMPNVNKKNVLSVTAFLSVVNFLSMLLFYLLTELTMSHNDLKTRQRIRPILWSVILLNFITPMIYLCIGHFSK